MTIELWKSLRIKALKKVFEQIQFGELQVTFPDGELTSYRGNQDGPKAGPLCSHAAARGGQDGALPHCHWTEQGDEYPGRGEPRGETCEGRSGK